MRLYIAEKPSMGREIAANLPGPQRKGNGFIETGAGTVTWLVGHVLRQAEPQEYDAKYKIWKAEDLPIVPQKWQLLVAESSAKQFHIVKGLIDKADEIVHAGDPDREGQLLVDEVLEYVGNQKPVLRILLNALDEKSVKDAIAHLRDNKDFFNLKQSALARARADWMIGMNLSRAYTLAAQRAGHRKLVLPVGRVKTPTLALVVRREREIENFKPVDHYNIKGEFQHANGSFVAQWKPKDIQAGLDSEGRLIDKAIAEAKLQEFLESPNDGQITGYSKSKKQEQQRLPFSLSSLQVLAGKIYGYDPQQVLDTAQKLYEQKLTTYPRSDCEYLPTNQFKEAGRILSNLAGYDNENISQWAKGADSKIKSKAWNDSKISAHHAIIPTGVKADASKLSLVEKNIYYLVAQAYIAQFYPVHTYNQTKVEVTYKDELFTASGRVEIDLGWKALYTSKKKAGDSENNDNNDSNEENSEENGDSGDGTLPEMKKNDIVTYKNGKLGQSVTKPPTRFTQATLIAAMKEIHKFVQDPEAKKQLKAVYGIGTEATRATILDEMIHKRRLMTEKGKKKYLQPTPEAYLLIDAMPQELAYPDFTAIWEDKLHSMAEGDGTLDDFMASQIKFTAEMCGKAYDVKLVAEGEIECPRCHTGIMQKRKGRNGAFWGCSNYPRCRMTCNDKDGKPDFSSRQGGSFDGFAGFNSADNAGNAAMAEVVKPVASYTQRSDGTADEYAELGNFGAPEMMFGNSSHNRYGNNSYGNKRKNHASAAPMEKLGSNEQNQTKGKHLCPRCREGSLRQIKGANGLFWGCSNYPRCTATFDDYKGMPLLNP
ncbi:MAG: DNA topoisomerase 3 [Anaerovibrio sp.]|nr:DNA topoisomerase 3 [Selenomonadaceae bacterium]MDD6397934.1 DNA topoisomerase 3 [Selenomonadaceae bacterium]MDY6053706.1 DNA topoisomerase 3 [Anaerovibrio sp.]